MGVANVPAFVGHSEIGHVDSRVALPELPVRHDAAVDHRFERINDHLGGLELGEAGSGEPDESER